MNRQARINHVPATGHVNSVKPDTAKIIVRRSVPGVVLGLDLGADDYVTKPFPVRELLARVGALLRRTQPDKPSLDQLTVEKIIIDFRSYEARKAGKPLDMTRREFQILRDARFAAK